MSMALIAELNRIRAELEALRLSYRALQERVQALEAAEPVELPPRRPGRPPKVTQQ